LLPKTPKPRDFFIFLFKTQLISASFSSFSIFASCRRS